MLSKICWSGTSLMCAIEPHCAVNTAADKLYAFKQRCPTLHPTKNLEESYAKLMIAPGGKIVLFVLFLSKSP